jgi:8-hydroxy-5-deazaflavin:NADPH oxidoreductase
VKVGILGGTGPLGSGLALRLAQAGTPVVIGSRDQERASEKVADLLAPWSERQLDVSGAANEVAAGCDIVVVATPWEAAVDTVKPLASALQGRIVISVGNALMKVGREFQAVTPPRGSVAAMLQSTLPASKLVAACHHLPARELLDLDGDLDSDVLVCSDDPDAALATVEALEVVEGLRPLYTGSLAAAATVEAFTAILVSLNVRYKAHTTLKIGGLPDRDLPS